MSIVELLNSQSDLIAFSPASQKDIKKAETMLNLKFAKEYKDYIATFGCAIFKGYELTGICDGKRLDVSRVTIDERQHNEFVPNDWYVVETLDIDGIVIWQNEKGEIYQTFPNGDIKKIHNSLCEYIENV